MNENKYSFWVLFLLFVLISCTNKERQIDELIQTKNYQEAQSLLDNLGKDEISGEQIKEFQAKIRFSKLLDSLSLLDAKSDYNYIDSIIVNNIEKFQLYSHIQDSLSSVNKKYALINFNGIIDSIHNLANKNDYSFIISFIDSNTQTFKSNIKISGPLNHIRKQYAFTGAKYYSSKKKTKKAYQCILKYVSDNTLDESQKQILNKLKIKAIAGIWAGRMISGKMQVRMRIEPLGTSSFTGRVLFKSMGILSELENGTFDGVNLSAIYPIKISRYQKVMKGITGVYNNGKLTMRFPIVVTVTNTQSDGDFRSSTTYESKIVYRKCIMSKVRK